MSLHIQIDATQIAVFCQRHHIRKFAFFGSVLRDDFRPDSDVDVLVEFEPGCVPGLITLMSMQLEFSEMIGRDADFRTPRDLSTLFRDRVVAEAEVLYAA
ncbi:MAG TPA: nucleotidyltransferase family protein [Armatimonadota bacterium]